MVHKKGFSKDKTVGFELQLRLYFGMLRGEEYGRESILMRRGYELRGISF